MSKDFFKMTLFPLCCAYYKVNGRPRYSTTDHCMYEENHQLLKITNHHMMWENAVIINIKIEKTKQKFFLPYLLELSRFQSYLLLGIILQFLQKCMCNLKFEYLKVIWNWLIFIHLIASTADFETQKISSNTNRSAV